MIKLILSIVTMVVFAANLVAGPAMAAEKFKVVTTFTVIADMARNVAGNAAIVESITKPNAEIHEYDPTPGDIVRAQGADLILWNGLHLETWFEKFFQKLKGVPEVTVTEGITPIPIADGPSAGVPNPHSWMSPGNGLIYVDNIRNALVKYDPANAETYRENAKAYKQRIKAAIDPIRKRIDSVPKDKRWLVSSEGAFSYLARDFDLKEAYLWAVNTDQEGTPQQIRKVIDLVRKNHIPAVFSESTISPKPAQQVARETDAVYGGALYVDSLSEPDGPTPTYIDLLRVTTDTLTKGLLKGVEDRK